MKIDIINGCTQNFSAMYKNQLYSWRYEIANKKISLINLKKNTGIKKGNRFIMRLLINKREIQKHLRN